MSLIAEVQKINHLPVHNWTLADYHAMIEAGVLNSAHKVELLFGKIVDMHPVGRAHAQTVNKINRLFGKKLQVDEYLISVQNPISLPGNSEPEPDICIATAPFEKYNDHHPRPEDILLLIEVADSTLPTDRGAKCFAYALAGIEEYWIIDVYGRRIERYTRVDAANGKYQLQEKYREGDDIPSLHLGDFAVADLMVQYD